MMRLQVKVALDLLKNLVLNYNYKRDHDRFTF